MMRYFIFSVFISFVASAPPDHDWSLKALCIFHNSQYTQRVGDGILSETGDKCVFKLPVSTANEKMARKFCNIHIPYHINSVVSGIDVTECHAEATLMCEPGWIQFYGRCYFAIKDVMTKEKAKNTCSAITIQGVKQEKKIAFLHRRELARHWKEYFTNVSHIWLEASEGFIEKLEHKKGPNLLLAFEGYHFGVRNDWVLTVPAATEASVVCEYTPQMTKAESNYLLHRYSDIYYQHVSTSAGAFVRSASARVGMTEDKTMTDNDYCARLFKPFISNIDAQAAFPDKEVIDELLVKPKPEIIRTSVRSRDALERVRNISLCGLDKQSMNYGVYGRSITNKPIFRKSPDGVWMNDQPADECDGASWSSGISLAKSTNRLTTMSDAKPEGTSGPPESTLEIFMKKTGQLFHAKPTVNPHMLGAGNHRVWLGAKKKNVCVERYNRNEWNGAFDPNPNDHCSRLRIFQWHNGVATNPPLFEEKWMEGTLNGDKIVEPNFYGDEQCVELMKGEVENWGNIKGKTGTQIVNKKLNDLDCDHYNRGYFCGKEAPIIVKTLTS